eukprot:TRINITY_DN181_c0_g1_i3.p1 TRINITY_DN181_c0_g1~~TRINITY_DN181_c0_g1_i3.p1  ORF type:complete len:274 (+),score=46.70 TRINITY_DN181_c0_g1_i3:1299-2120(+)
MWVQTLSTDPDLIIHGHLFSTPVIHVIDVLKPNFSCSFFFFQSNTHIRTHNHTTMSKLFDMKCIPATHSQYRSAATSSACTVICLKMAGFLLSDDVAVVKSEHVDCVLEETEELMKRQPSYSWETHKETEAMLSEEPSFQDLLCPLVHTQLDFSQYGSWSLVYDAILEKLVQTAQHFRTPIACLLTRVPETLLCGVWNESLYYVFDSHGRASQLGVPNAALWVGSLEAVKEYFMEIIGTVHYDPRQQWIDLWFMSSAKYIPVEGEKRKDEENE